MMNTPATPNNVPLWLREEQEKLAGELLRQNVADPAAAEATFRDVHITEDLRRRGDHALAEMEEALRLLAAAAR